MKQLQRTFEQVFRKIADIFSFATVLETKNGYAKVKFSDQDIQDGVQVLAPYGFHSVPTKNSRCMILSAGERNQSIVIAGGSEKLRGQFDHTAGAVQLLEEGGASITLKNGKVFIGKSKDGLSELNLELVGILKNILSQINPQALPTPLVEKFKKDVGELEKKWG